MIDDDGVHTAYLDQLGAVAYLARPDYVCRCGGDAGRQARWSTSCARTWLAAAPRSAHDRGATAEVLDPAVAALHRAMPYTRLVDCGMNPADARALLAATAAGEAWADAAGELPAPAGGRQSALAAGHRLTAAQSARWAAGAALFAHMADNEDTPRKRVLYRRYVDLVSQVAELSGQPSSASSCPTGTAGWSAGSACRRPAARRPPSSSGAACPAGARPTSAPPTHSPPAG